LHYGNAYHCHHDGKSSIWLRIAKPTDLLSTLDSVEMGSKGLQDEGATGGALEFL